jgi:ribosomal-protein-alanine N-acetyltransferase
LKTKAFQEPWSFEGFRELIANPSFASMGIFLDQKLVGYIFYYLVMDELHVMNVAIDPAFRKKGLGESLLNKVHDKGKKHSIKFAYLEVRETNESAQKLVRKIGLSQARPPHRVLFQSRRCIAHVQRPNLRRVDNLIL